MATQHGPNASFTQEEGLIHLGGIEALLRFPLDRARADGRRGFRP